jgi:dephospho-CoA kinase
MIIIIRYSEAISVKVIGLCGGSGSGKGCVAELMSKYGFNSIDTDKVYHEIISRKSECTDALSQEFGEEILNDDGSVNRKKLSSIVFHGDISEVRRARLNQIAHFHVLKKCREIIESYRIEGSVGVLVDAPLLFESGFDKECDLILAVIAEPATRISRIMVRDKISYDNAKIRIKAQLSDEYLKDNADFVIYNDGDIITLANEVDKIVKIIKEQER